MKRMTQIHGSAAPRMWSRLNCSRRAAMVLSLPVIFLAGCVAAVDGANDETTQVSEALVLCRLQACSDTRPVKQPPAHLPDLTASRFHRGAVAGHVVNVENLGTGEAAASSTFVDYGAFCRQHVATPAIAAGSSVLLPLTLPEHCFGPDVSYTVRVDEYGAVAESDETNNTLVFAPLPQQACASGVPGCGGWHDGDMVTYTQADWGDIPNGSNIASVLEASYGTVYAPWGIFEIGLPGAAGYSIIFSDSTSLIEYLPAVSPLGPLDADLADPMSSASGSFGGDVAALKLNIDFSAVGLIHGTAAAKFGDLRLCGLTTTPSLNGHTVRDALVTLNTALAGVPTTRTIPDLDLLARELDGAFFNGTPSAFAQEHLIVGICPL